MADDFEHNGAQGRDESYTISQWNGNVFQQNILLKRPIQMHSADAAAAPIVANARRTHRPIVNRFERRTRAF
jgi:hypothetical protein